MSDSLVVRTCVHCGSPEVDLWLSWNVAGEWVCADCGPVQAVDDDDDWV